MAIAAIAGVVAAAGAALYAAWQAIPEAGKDIAREEFERVMKGQADDYTNAAIKSGFERLGLDIDPEEGITPHAITEAINTGPLAGTGIEFRNIFDKEQVKRDLMKLALQQAAEAYGVKVSGDLDQIKQQLKQEATQRLMDQVGEGAGDWLEVAPDLVEIVRAVNAAVKEGLVDENGGFKQPGLYMDEYHVKLRERQARYLANHKRKWVKK